MVPSGDRVTLLQGEEAIITQELGGSFTVVINGNMFRIDGKNADALGRDVPQKTEMKRAETPEELEQLVWEQMKTTFDPEIPVNIVDLGLIYKCEVKPIPNDTGYSVEIAMTLTAPGCGMGDHLRQDVLNKVLQIEGVEDVDVQLVWEPQWNQDMMSEAAKLQLGMY